MATVTLWAMHVHVHGEDTPYLLFTICTTRSGSQTWGWDPKWGPEIILWGPQMISLMSIFLSLSHKESNIQYKVCTWCLLDIYKVTI